jgi:hypothetical protein
MNANLSNEHINGLKAGIQDVMQGLMTLNKVLTMIQVPESAKWPDGRPQLHDSHVEAYKRHHGIHDSHVECRDRFKASLHDSHVARYFEYLTETNKPSQDRDEGECFIVPKGVDHKPEAVDEAHVMMFEPKATEHTGDVKSDLVTVNIEDQEWV